MKRIRLVAIPLLTAALLSACTQPLPASSVSISTRPPTGAPAETAVPLPATEAGTPGTGQVLEGPEISYKGIHFTLDPSIGSRVYVFDDVVSLNGQTAHTTRFALTPEPHCVTWCVEIYPIAEFEQLFGFFVFPPAGYRGGAAVIFKAQEKALSFPYGSGSRALEAFGQNHYGISNESLNYVFRGYDLDRQYGLFVQAPVRASALPDAAPTMPSGGNSAAEILAYNARAADTLNGLSPADFTPALDVLDTLVESIHVETR